MSLPDTIFIFVLALIIFGPKKLPEIGRQIGRLVGEFRRASNEFKFQIEEELRQVDLNDQRTQQQTIAAKKDPRPENRILNDSTSPAGEAGDALPVGQHPNIENLDVSALNTAVAPSESPDGRLADAFAPPRIETAEGSEPRNAAPYAYTEPVAELPPASELTSQNGIASSNGAVVAADEASFTAEDETLQPSLTHADANHG